MGNGRRSRELSGFPTSICGSYGAHYFWNGGQLEEQKTSFVEKTKEAREDLVKAFDDAIKKVRALSKNSPAEQLKLIDALEEEKETFENRGHVPFSPGMRQSRSCVPQGSQSFRASTSQGIRPNYQGDFQGE